MKKVNFKTVTMVLTFVAAFLLTGVGSLQAQSELATPPGITIIKGLTPAIPQGNFFGVDEAKTTLWTNLLSTKEFLKNPPFSPGSAAFIAAERQIMYHMAIREKLNQGETVPFAINNGLNIFLSDENGILSTSILQTLRNDAIALLSN